MKESMVALRGTIKFEELTLTAVFRVLSEYSYKEQKVRILFMPLEVI